MKPVFAISTVNPPPPSLLPPLFSLIFLTIGQLNIHTMKTYNIFITGRPFSFFFFLHAIFIKKGLCNIKIYITCFLMYSLYILIYKKDPHYYSPKLFLFLLILINQKISKTLYKSHRHIRAERNKQR
ncbi:MAG: hypothetical protein EXX96DRAFT_207536 [Benjaminiella poitrasii]|nr:MAG: hypothetical protein EXX96DRAFT_207536 [Benjaminiella poitrasii]